MVAFGERFVCRRFAALRIFLRPFLLDTLQHHAQPWHVDDSPLRTAARLRFASASKSVLGLERGDCASSNAPSQTNVHRNTCKLTLCIRYVVYTWGMVSNYMFLHNDWINFVTSNVWERRGYGISDPCIHWCMEAHPIATSDVYLPQVKYLHFNMQFFFVELSTHHGHSVGYNILDNPQETMYIYIIYIAFGSPKRVTNMPHWLKKV